MSPPSIGVDARSPRAPLISVITVCFNAMATLQNASDSLSRQEFDNFEWVVVDGASKDGTVDWLTEHRDRMAAFVSEPDNGIYDAMNKALRLARGEWVFFLNADDRLVDPQVLADVAPILSTTPGDIGLVYGNARYTDGKREWPRDFGWVSSRNLVYGDLCHQVIFARRSLFRSVGEFDVTLRFNADFDWLLRVLRSGAGMLHLARDIAYFFKGGAHVKSAEACEAERFTVRYRYRHPVRWRLGNLALRAELKLRRMRGEAV